MGDISESAIHPVPSECEIKTRTPHPSDIESTLYIGLEQGRVHSVNEFWTTTIQTIIEDYFGEPFHGDVNIEEFGFYTDASFTGNGSNYFAGVVEMRGIRKGFCAGYFGGMTGVLPEKSGLVEDESIPSATVNELAEMWDEEWGWIDYSDPAALVVHDKGVPLHIKNTIERTRPSCVAVEYVDERGTGIESSDVVEKVSERTSNDDEMCACGEAEMGEWHECSTKNVTAREGESPMGTMQRSMSNGVSKDDTDDTSCTDGGDSDDQSHTDSNSDEQSFEEDMKDVAGELEDKAFRERRDEFKAEIVDLGYLNEVGRGVYIECDVPTTDTEEFYFNNPQKDCGFDIDFTELLDYLGVDLRSVDMIEGMSVPVGYDDGVWNLRLDKGEEWNPYLNIIEGVVDGLVIGWVWLTSRDVKGAIINAIGLLSVVHFFYLIYIEAFTPIEVRGMVAGPALLFFLWCILRPIHQRNA